MLHDQCIIYKYSVMCVYCMKLCFVLTCVIFICMVLHGGVMCCIVLV